MEFLNTLRTGVGNFLQNPIVSAVSAAGSLIGAIRTFTGGSESAASGQTGALAQGDPRFSNLPANIASGQESAQSGENAFGGGFFPQSYSTTGMGGNFAQGANQAN